MVRKHSIFRVTSCELTGPFTLRIGFDDNTHQIIDMRPILAGELYGPLRDPALFSQFRIDPEVHTLVWPNGADFDPATLHDWPQQAPVWIERAEQWRQAAAPDSTM